MPLRDLDQAVHVVGVAPFSLNLNGRVRNPEITLQFVGDRAQDVLTAGHALFFDRDVTTTGNNACTNRPNMQIMNRQYTCYVRDSLLNIIHVDALGDTLQ